MWNQWDSLGSNKDVSKIDLIQIKNFDTYLENEFRNQPIDKILQVFQIERFLNMKCYPYNTTVDDTTYKVIKIEFINNKSFEMKE